MLTAFANDDGRLSRLGPDADRQALAAAVWIDLAEPSPQERQLVDSLHGTSLPAAEELQEIEASSRSYVHEEGLHFSSMFLQRMEGRAEIVNAALRVSDSRLVTLHDPEIPALRLLRMRADRRLTDGTPVGLLQGLYEIKLDDLADSLEEIQQELDVIGEAALARSGGRLADSIDQLTRLEHRNSKIRLCLMDAQRDLAFLMRHGELDKAMRRGVASLLRDANSLLPHCNFLFEKVGFLLQALHGAINIEQNQVIKILSVAAVIFLPPTLIASLYGMNFEFMPELHWQWGYPATIALMIFSGVAPYVFFRRKGWL